MDPEEYECRWLDFDCSSEYAPDCIATCSHPMIKGFCDFAEEGDYEQCPFFEYAKSLHEVEIRQHLEMADGSE